MSSFFLPWLPINLFDVRIFYSYYPQLCPVKLFLKSLFGKKVMGQSKGTSIKCVFVNDITIIIIEHYGCLLLLHLQPVMVNSRLAGKNKLQTFDRNKLPLLRTLANEATNSQGPHNVLYKGSWLYHFESYCVIWLLSSLVVKKRWF